MIDKKFSNFSKQIGLKDAYMHMLRKSGTSVFVHMPRKSRNRVSAFPRHPNFKVLDRTRVLTLNEESNFKKKNQIFGGNMVAQKKFHIVQKAKSKSRFRGNPLA